MTLYFLDDDQAQWLLTESQLRVWLAEHGVTMRSDVPPNGRWRGKPLYDPQRALRFCQQLEAWRT
jgi:hypothetical protein